MVQKHGWYGGVTEVLQVLLEFYNDVTEYSAVEYASRIVKKVI